MRGRTISESGNNIKSISVSTLSRELAEKITQGDSHASNAFVQMNYRWLLFIIRKKFSQSNNHEDIVQDSFMLVINKLQQGKVRETKAILGFLRTTAINIGFEYLRKDKKFTSAVDQEYLEMIEDAQDGILSTLIWNDKVKYVKQVMSELKVQRDKDILIKFYFHDQDKPAICEELNLSREHFDRVLYRAKQRLKQLIDSDSGDNNSNNNIKSISSIKRNDSSHNVMREIFASTINYITRKVGLPTKKLLHSLTSICNTAQGVKS